MQAMPLRRASCSFWLTSSEKPSLTTLMLIRSSSRSMHSSSAASRSLTRPSGMTLSTCSSASGAQPTTPCSVLDALMMPAQCVPCDAKSWVQLLLSAPPLVKSLPRVTWRSSGCELSQPESMIPILTPLPVKRPPSGSTPIRRWPQPCNRAAGKPG